MSEETMYDKHLDSFVKTAELGSFAKAGDALFISPTAVIKQVNLLERDLGVHLFERGSRGVRLTAAGEIVYRNALAMMRLADETLRDARRADLTAAHTVRLAASPMRPPGRVRQWWTSIAREHPSIKLEIKQVSDTMKSWTNILNNLADKVDLAILVKPYPDSWSWQKRCMIQNLFVSPSYLAVPLDHRLASKERILLADLEGERLYCTMEGANEEIDRMRSAIANSGLDIEIVSCPPYDIDAYNEAALSGSLVFSCADLGDVHPSFVNIPCELECPLMFCLISSSDPQPWVTEFIAAITDEARRNT